MKNMKITPHAHTIEVREIAEKTRHLRSALPLLLEKKELILHTWLSYKAPKKILEFHTIEKAYFIKEYATGIFDYFMHVISGEVAIGNCPAIQTFLDYLKDKDIQAGELYEICSHFRRAMIDIGFEKGFGSQEYANEIYFIFDKNFRGVLRFYTDTIFQKEQEINRHVKLLTEYKKALDEGALITKTNSLGEITYVNEKFIQLCGYEEEELLGYKHNIMRHPEMTKEFYKNLWDELQSKNIFRATIKNYKKNKEYYYIDVTIVKINDPYDNKTEYMSIGYEVTKLVDARAEALQASQV
ncbi:MAG: PAS domain S-box protein, partial [Sulfurimonadaceae bacterium]|nr:PAS domain S-box protein [Sulfurimonadaceae bacterium]